MDPSLLSLPQPPTHLTASKDGSTEQGSTGELITLSPSQLCGHHTPLARGGGGLLYLVAGSAQIFLLRQEGTIISPAGCFSSLLPAVAAGTRPLPGISPKPGASLQKCPPSGWFESSGLDWLQGLLGAFLCHRAGGGRLPLEGLALGPALSGWRL